MMRALIIAITILTAAAMIGCRIDLSDRLKGG